MILQEVVLTHLNRHIVACPIISGAFQLFGFYVAILQKISQTLVKFRMSILLILQPG
ncbi:hypothetical protein EVA_20807 [gut metagenome]|uniref:Uncharacterized protein n=1 Tax=gut metagenome TaxID=749906 RepID=J9BU72_9ZZZZ